VIVVDTSALIALLLNEPSAERIASRIAGCAGAIVPASVYVEASLVYGGRQGEAGLRRLDDLIADLGLTLAPFTMEHARAAQRAFMMYGKGHHPAALNFGDCMSYAVASVEALPLLFAGRNFALTDVQAA
jgi:ribonuclease VapC